MDEACEELFARATLTLDEHAGITAGEQAGVFQHRLHTLAAADDAQVGGGSRRTGWAHRGGDSGAESVPRGQVLTCLFEVLRLFEVHLAAVGELLQIG